MRRQNYIPVRGADLDMSKRAGDLSLEELAALGANAALQAAKRAADAGLSVTGTVDFLEDGQAKSSIAERHPSGTITLRAAEAGIGDTSEGADSRASRPGSSD